MAANDPIADLPDPMLDPTDPQTDPKCHVAAVVPAAGCGERMAHETPKQYLEVCGRPLIVYCLASFEEVPWLTRVVVVADDVQRMTRVVREAGLSKVRVVQGRATRHRSIRVGLSALSDDPPEVVVIHDGVRPLVPLSTLRQVVTAAAERGAAGAVRPLVSTVLRPAAAPKASKQQESAGGHEVLQESLVRSDFRNSEMPQAFRYPVITQAYDSCTDEELDHGTECLALALKHTGVSASLVPGTPHLWKVTEARDLVVARTVLPRHTRHMALFCRAPPHDSALGITPTELGETDPANEDAGRARRISEPLLTSVASGSEPAGSLDDDVVLECGAECVRVMRILAPRLRSHSTSLRWYHSLQDLRRLPTNAGGRLSVVVVAVASLRGPPPPPPAGWSLRPHLEQLKRGLSADTSSLILVLSLEEDGATTEDASSSSFPSKSSHLSLLDVTDLQKDVRQVFQGHRTSVTILLRNPGERIQSPSAADQKEEGQRENENQLLDLMEALLQEHSRAFHGQVLVL
ncbi:uncharacterized protein LOC122243094 [Penaeus japonicus]|uniref:uncharacterized protein LOC122243094 n=1 Tax=Penaeus japonicus TaxID=27405 RepID=UPI001C714C91|nr:uncharacterized protein LOC122243094 [Penaeus japonicus]